jgi:hypothetical protein
MLLEIVEACFPVIVFLIVAYWLQAYTKAELDEEWNNLNKKQ